MAVIYGLFDPRKTLDLENCRYIGKTKISIEQRLKQHLWQMDWYPNNYRNKWLKSLRSADITPTIIQIDEETDGLDINTLEKQWIAFGRSNGWRLTNATNGGDGFSGSHRPETKIKLSEALKQFDQDHPEARIQRSLVQKQRYASQAEREKTGAAISTGIANTDQTDQWCPECDSGPFLGIWGLASHRKYDHNPTPETCPNCNDGPFLGQAGLAAHKQHRHSTVHEPLMCECGGGPFKGTHGLGIHRGRFCPLNRLC